MAILHLLGILTALLLWSAPVIAATDGDETPHCDGLTGTQVCIASATYTADICAAIEVYADHFALPPGFFARLIWQESRFDPNAISPAGAQGVAQFMPSTARLRALTNPFDPAQALGRSAEYLNDLAAKFGNLGLAAAAYNGGERRIENLVSGISGVAGETRAFVSIITGQSIDYWLGTAEPVDYALHPDKPFGAACIDMAKSVPMPAINTETGQWQPWGVLIAQNFSPDIARAAFTRAKTRYADLFAGQDLLFITGRNLSLGTRLRYSAQVGFPTRQEADAFCGALLGRGGNCLVQRNE